MLKKSLLFTFVLFLAATAMMQAPADKPGADSPARFLPADTFLYIELKDVKATAQRKDALALFKLFADEEIKTFIEELENAAKKEDTPPEKTFSGIKDTIFDAYNTFAEGLQGEMCFAIPHSENGRPAGGVFMARYATDKAGNVKTALESLASLADAQITFSETDVQGIKAVGAAVEGVPKTLYFAVVNDMLILTTDAGLLAKQAAYLTKPPEKTLADNPVFLKVYEQAVVKDLFWYYDNLQLTKLMEPFMQMAAAMGGPFQGLVEISKKYTNMNKAVGGDMNLVGEDVVENIYSILNEQADPDAIRLMKKWASLNWRMKAAPMFPKDALVFFDTVMDFGSLYEVVEPMFTDAIRNSIIDVENKLMLSVKDDLIPAFGNEIGVYFTMQFMMPSFLVAIEVKDSNTVGEALKVLPTFSQGLVPFEYNGENFYRVSGQGLPISVAFGLHNGFLLLGTENAVKAAVKGMAETIADNERFKEILTLAKQAQNAKGIMFLDTKAGIGLLYDTAMQFLQARLAQMENFDPATIPSRDAVVGYMKPIGGYFAYNPDGTTHACIKGMFPVLVFQAVNPLIYGLGLIPVPGGPPPDEGGDIF